MGDERRAPYCGQREKLKSRNGDLEKVFTLRKKSDAHGHDDVAVAVGLVGERPHLPGGLFVLQLDTDRAIGRGAKKIQHVAGVETDGDGFAFEFLDRKSTRLNSSH